MYSKGISWIDDCRIPFVDEGDIPNDMDKTHLKDDRMFLEREGYKPFLYKQNTTGRFPANLLVSDDMLNDGSITKQSQRTYKPTDNTASLFGNSPQAHGIGIGDKGTNSRYYDIDKWFNNLIDV
jgi:hypothetical protein